MDDILLEKLLAQRHAVAHAWHRALGRTVPTMRDKVTEAQVLALVERFAALLCREPFEAEAARTLGAAVAAFSTEPEVLILSQEVLVRHLAEVAHAEELAGHQLRLTRLFGEMATGFYGMVRVEGERAAFRYILSMRYQLAGVLNQVVGFSGVILKGIDGPVTALQEKDLTIIQQAGARIVRTLNDLADIGKIRLGMLELDREVFEVQEMMQPLIDMLRTYQARVRPTQTLDVSYGSGLGRMEADSFRIRQIIQYLVEDIICYTDEGTIGLTIRREDSQSESHLRFEVRSPELRLSESYQTYWSTPRTNPYSHWLEGDLLRALIDLMGGTLAIEGKGGSGSLFTLQLPASMAV